MWVFTLCGLFPGSPSPPLPPSLHPMHCARLHKSLIPHQTSVSWVYNTITLGYTTIYIALIYNSIAFDCSTTDYNNSYVVICNEDFSFIRETGNVRLQDDDNICNRYDNDKNSTWDDIDEHEMILMNMRWYLWTYDDIDEHEMILMNIRWYWWKWDDIDGAQMSYW